MNFEYEVLDGDLSRSELRLMLNEYSSRGWRLLQIYQRYNAGGIYAVMEKPVENKPVEVKVPSPAIEIPISVQSKFESPNKSDQRNNKHKR